MEEIVSRLMLLSEEDMMKSLHYDYAIEFDGQIARILECELYRHDDPYTHGNERQREIGTFYVHRTGTLANDSYKGGTFKGIDITCNGGILIRSIHIIGSGTIIEGPCNVVDHLTLSTGWTLAELEDRLHLIEHEWPQTDHHILGARVGLTLKRAKDSEILEWAKFLIMPRRSAIFVPKKHKETWFVTDPHRTDVPSRVRAKYQKEMEDGRNKELSRASTQLEVAGYLSFHH